MVKQHVHIFNKKIEGRDYLRNQLQSTLYKDIVKRFKIRSVQGIEDLALYLMWKWLEKQPRCP